MLIIRSRRVVLPGEVSAASVEIRDGRITAIEPFDSTPEGAEVVDAGDKYVLPGLVDSHVHINEPGRTAWEGFRTATRAAAAGGYTTLIDMPLNNLPETTTVENLRLKQSAARGQCVVDYGFWGGVVADNQAHVGALASAGVLGYKCFLVHPGIDGFTMVTRAQFEAAMPEVAASGLPLLVHAELPGPIEEATARLNGAGCDWKRYSTYLASRPDAAEVEAIRLMIGLSGKFGCRVHIVHLSSAEALPELRAARREGLPITVETCPHYLHFSAEDVADGATLYKCAPPIRSRTNRERLWQALADGDIDLIATDHSPCLPEMKRRGDGSFLEAWGGIASLQVALPVVWTQALRRGISISQVVRWMGEQPAKLAGVGHRKGVIREGSDADLVVFDPYVEFRVDAARLEHRHPLTPYDGETLSGVVEMTLLRGEKVFDHGEFPREPRGVQCFRA
ncbi:MAG TPA: allantoinase AllB [Bryobacteraceae bacterium]|nr:allantoinase AllB [Bryobacteraceae bacterium]